MAVRLLIEGLDLQDNFGIVLEDGGVNATEKPPVPRTAFFNEWEDESGKDYDDSAPVVFQSSVIELPFLIKANSMAEYRQKKDAFLALIVVNKDISFEITGLTASLNFRYVETMSWEFINIGLTSITTARFVLRFEKNHR